MPDDGPLAVFRTDARVETGFGHMMRCTALADALDTAGWRCAFAAEPSPHMADSRFERLELAGGEASEPAALRERWAAGCDLLVVDHYERGAQFEIACRPWARRILAIDDRPNRPHDCDMLLDQTLNRDASDYRPLTPEGCRFFLGPRHALLRRQFAEGGESTRNRGAAIRRILVAMGGTDAADATSAALQWISAAAPGMAVSVMLGGAAPHRQNVEKLAKTLPNPVSLHIDAGDVAALMAEADLSIGAAGSTSWERCAMGLPSLVVVVADNQADIAQALHDAGAAVSLGRFDGIDGEAAMRALRGLIEDGNARAAMAVAARTLCDGRGAGRVAAAVAA